MIGLKLKYILPQKRLKISIYLDFEVYTFSYKKDFLTHIRKRRYILYAYNKSKISRWGLYSTS